jgi:hypothetical protein
LPHGSIAGQHAHCGVVGARPVRADDVAANAERVCCRTHRRALRDRRRVHRRFCVRARASVYVHFLPVMLASARVRAWRVCACRGMHVQHCSRTTLHSTSKAHLTRRSRRPCALPLNDHDNDDSNSRDDYKALCQYSVRVLSSAGRSLARGARYMPTVATLHVLVCAKV